MTILSIRIDIVWQNDRSHSSASACLLSFDHLQMPAMACLISNRVGMTALYGFLRILLCFEFVPPPNLLFFTLVFVLPRPPPFFLGGGGGSELPSFFWSENFCWTFRPADWHFLSDILKKRPIVWQIRRISTALLWYDCNLVHACMANNKIFHTKSSLK